MILLSDMFGDLDSIKHSPPINQLPILGLDLFSVH